MSGGAGAETRWKLIQYHMEDWLCWFVSASLSATPYAFLKRLEPYGLLFIHPHIPFHLFTWVYREAGADRGYRKAEADLPYSFIYCDLKDNSCSLD